MSLITFLVLSAQYITGYACFVYPFCLPELKLKLSTISALEAGKVIAGSSKARFVFYRLLPMKNELIGDLVALLQPSLDDRLEFDHYEFRYLYTL